MANKDIGCRGKEYILFSYPCIHYIHSSYFRKHTGNYAWFGWHFVATDFQSKVIKWHETTDLCKLVHALVKGQAAREDHLYQSSILHSVKTILIFLMIFSSSYSTFLSGIRQWRDDFWNPILFIAELIIQGNVLLSIIIYKLVVRAPLENVMLVA